MSRPRSSRRQGNSMDDIKQYPEWQKAIREAQAAAIVAASEKAEEAAEESINKAVERAKFFREILAHVGIESVSTSDECVIGQYKFVLRDTRQSYDRYYAGVALRVERADL